MKSVAVVVLALAAAAGAQQLYEGSRCSNERAGREGVCQHLNTCPWAQEEIRHHRYPQICTWSGKLPVVCCPEGSGHSAGLVSRPPPSTSTTRRPLSTRPGSAASSRGRIAKKKCEEYSQYVFKEDESYALSPLALGERIDQCAKTADALVVGGEEAMPREFPHMALIGYGERDAIEYQCGGSLISPNYVMTAAHCLVAPGNRPARWVLLGELDRSTDQDEAAPQLIEVDQGIRHPDWKPPQHYNDVALLRMTRAADLNGYVRPACLHTQREIRNTKEPLATGWGHTEWAGDPSDKLMKVSLKVQPYRVCNESYQSNVGRTLPRGILDDLQLCAGVLEGGKDTCQGDSGGPLQLFSYQNPYCMHYIIGITSFGKACGFRNSPAVYSRVSTYVPWIEGIVWPGQQCSTEAGAPGVCKYLSSCAWAVEELRGNGSQPKICAFLGPYPIVCCPSEIGDRNRVNPSTAPTPPSSGPPPSPRGALANKKCSLYAQYVFTEIDSLTLMASTVKVDQCAASADPLIVGGSRAKPMEFPHMALIGFDKEDGAIEYTCGGSLISPGFVMTAAHCLIAPWEQPARWVLLGELDRSSNTDDAKPQVVEVAQRIQHPDYAPPAKYHDIALLRLAQPAQVSGYVRPACLHTDLDVVLRADLSESMVASGWGNTEFTGDPSEELMKVALHPASSERCRKAFSNAPQRELPRGIAPDTQLCAGGGGKDTCQGDSGGPLQLSTRNASGEAPQPYCMYKVVGITSFGRACGYSAPAVYTRVAAYVPWIESVVWPGERP